jgi:hypothetical protein
VYGTLTYGTSPYAMPSEHIEAPLPAPIAYIAAAPRTGSVPVGDTQQILVAFASRRLTGKEIEAFRAGAGLPAHVGERQETVTVEYEGPASADPRYGTLDTLEDGAPGEYIAELPLTAHGFWRLRGIAYDETGDQVAVTKDVTVQATRTFQAPA